MEKSSSSNFQSSHVYKWLLFAMGLSIGMTSTLYYKSIIFFFQTNISSSTTPFLLQPVPPSLSPPLASQPLPTLSVSPPPPAYKPLLLHEMDDEELFARALEPPKIERGPMPKSVPKVAFLFLIRGSISFGPLWEIFFKGHEKLYSIYVHPHPSHVDSIPQKSVFYKRRIPSKEVGWGESTVTDAERRLLASALLDPTNQRFVLLSESSIPLFNFTTIYNYLLNSPKCFVESYDNPGLDSRGRYRPNMFPEITVSQWRKGSQWFEVNRKVAVHIISDIKYYLVFLQHCNPPFCIADEHYIPTLINIVCPEESTNRTVTWVDWSKGGSHPRRFVKNDISQELIDQLRFGSNCTYNENTTTSCFLFARKFTPNALQPLLHLVPNVLFNNCATL